MNLKSLSKLLNLSQTTVSRALNGFPEVSQETRIRVEAAAKKYGYQPNAKAKGLATGRTHTIGHVIPVSLGNEIVNPIFSDFIAGANRAYMAANYDMLISMVADTDEEAAYQKLIARARVDGVIVHAPKDNDARVALLHALNIPFVVHGRCGFSDGYSWLDVDNTQAFFQGTKKLLELGHRRIGLINGLESLTFAQHRRAGYCQALQSYALPCDAALMARGDMTEPHGYISAGQMLDSAEPPSAFMVASMITAIGVRRAVEQRNMRLGREISLVAFDDDLSYLQDDQACPTFSCLRSSVREAGLRCAQNLLYLIQHPNADPIQELWAAQWFSGQSTATYKR